MHIDMQPQMDNRPDHEGAMARADLYKLANYSLKLFKMMDSNTQLEGWVQAKITKSADYIASVYHYLEYEMKFSEYGQAIDDSDVYTESQKRQLKNKLLEAKEKIKDLKKVQAEKAKKKEKKEELDEARATDKKKGAVTKSEKAQYFAKTTSKDGKTTKGSTHEAEEGESEGDVRDRVERDAKSKGETVDSFRKKELDEGKKKGDGNLANNAKPYDKITRGDVIAGRLGKDEKGGKKVKEGNTDAPAPMSALDKAKALGAAAAPGLKKAAMTYGAMKALGVKETAISGAPAKSGIPATAKTTVPGMRATQQDLKKAGASAALGEGKCNHTPKGEKCPVHGLKECGGMYEAKPSAGMTAKEKSAVAKKASAGKDIGKPGKSFDKVAKAAGGGEKGTKIAAAAMWKNQAKK